MEVLVSRISDTHKERCIIDDVFEPLAWGYNSFFMESHRKEIHHIELYCDTKGSYGSPSNFELKCAIITEDEIDYHTINSYQEKKVNYDIVLEKDQIAILVVTAMPKGFITDETFAYQIKINACDY